MRAIRNRYFARSAGAISDHLSANASRAVATARFTSSSRPRATSARCSSLEGDSVAIHSPEIGSTSLPPMKSP